MQSLLQSTVVRCEWKDNDDVTYKTLHTGQAGVCVCVHTTWRNSELRRSFPLNLLRDQEDTYANYW